MIRLENTTRLFKSVHRKIKTLFSHFQWREVLTFLFFLLLSFVFWMLESMQREYEIQLQIPVVYKDMPRDMAFVRTPPPAITVRIRDKGSVLLNYTLQRKRASVAVNMQDAGAPGNTLRLSEKDIEGIIMKQLIPTTDIISFSPEHIEAPYSRLQSKTIPIIFDGDIRTEPGFLVAGNIIITPSTTKVFASDAVLEKLTAAHTVYTKVDKGNSSVTLKLKLRKIDGATFSPDKVAVTIPIEEFTQKTLHLPVVCRDVPQGYAIRMFPSMVKATCNVPLSLFKDLSEKDFLLETFIADPEQNISGMIPLKLKKTPTGVDRVTLAQDSIEFILEQLK